MTNPESGGDKVGREGAPAHLSKRKGCFRWFLRLGVVGVVLLVAAVLWLNGPGIRWILESKVPPFLEEKGFEASLAVEGTLLGGLTFRDVSLVPSPAAAAGSPAAQGPLEGVRVGLLSADYDVAALVRGEFMEAPKEVVLKDVFVTLDLTKEKEDDPTLNG